MGANSSKSPEYLLPEYDMTEVRKHNKANNSWLVIDGYVYDVSTFRHPGGDIIEIGYGKDATNQFHNENVKHSKTAKKLLKSFLIGKVKTIDK
jgi:cytochrome b involved in lipid metabolism